MDTEPFVGIALKAMPCVGIAVRNEVFGSTCQFQFEDHWVQVAIPHVELTNGNEPVGKLASKGVHSSLSPNDPASTWFRLHFIIVEILVSEELFAPPALFDQHANAYELVGDETARTNEILLKSYDELLHRAVDHWQRVVRWVTRTSWLGAPTYRFNSTNEPSHGTRIIRHPDRKTFWIVGGYFAASGSTYLNGPAWAALRSCLADGETPPAWADFIHDAWHRAWSHDLNGAVLSAAVACETLIRSIAFTAAGSDARLQAKSEREPISNLLKRLSGLFVPHGSRGDLAGAVNVLQIFALRNRLMHDGAAVALDQAEVTSLLSNVAGFIGDAEDRLRTLKGQPLRFVNVDRHPRVAG